MNKINYISATLLILILISSVDAKINPAFDTTVTDKRLKTLSNVLFIAGGASLFAGYMLRFGFNDTRESTSGPIFLTSGAIILGGGFASTTARKIIRSKNFEKIGLSEYLDLPFNLTGYFSKDSVRLNYSGIPIFISSDITKFTYTLNLKGYFGDKLFEGQIKNLQKVNIIFNGKNITGNIIDQTSNMGSAVAISGDNNVISGSPGRQGRMNIRYEIDFCDKRLEGYCKYDNKTRNSLNADFLFGNQYLNGNIFTADDYDIIDLKKGADLFIGNKSIESNKISLYAPNYSDEDLMAILFILLIQLNL